ncbi:BF3164 family lipoprotein [Niastella populi]|nr:BF3164 family lipoprotein [Niastella populi]
MSIRFPLYLIIVTLFAGCIGGDKERDKMSEAFPVENKLHGEQVLKLDNFIPDYIDVYNDSLLCFVSTIGEKGHHIALYHLAERTFLPPILRVGGKDGQTLGFNTFGFERGYFWDYDPGKEKVIFTRLDSIHEAGASHFIREMPVPGFYYSLQLLNDSTLLTSGNYFHSQDDYKLATLDLTSGRSYNHMAPYSADSSKPYTLPQKMSYESFLFLKPSKNKCVLAYRFTDRIELIDLDTRKIKVIRGQDMFEPNLKVMVKGNGKKIAYPGDESREAYVRGQVTDKYIYLLYSGNLPNGKNLFYGKYIHIYDWDGKPVKRLELDNYTKDFAVTGNDSLLYTYDPKTKNISVAKLTN